MYGKFKKMELSKEHLLAFWDMVLNRADFNVRTGEKVEEHQEGSRRRLHRHDCQQPLSSHSRGAGAGPNRHARKLGVKGEDLPKVMYRLIEADHYINKNILVVGGGDSAVEAAMGLANQTGNQVTLSYRQERFSRIKERNAKRIEDYMRSGKIKVLFNSVPVEFKARIGRAAGQRCAPGNSQRFRLDFRRRYASLRLPQENRSWIRRPRSRNGGSK